MSGKVLAVDEKYIFRINHGTKSNCDVLMFKNAENMHHKITLMRKKRKKNGINWKTFKLFPSFFIGTNVHKSIKQKQYTCNFEDKNGHSKKIIINYNRL